MPGSHTQKGAAKALINMQEAFCVAAIVYYELLFLAGTLCGGHDCVELRYAYQGAALNELDLPRFDIRGLGGDHRTIPSTSSSHIDRNT